MQDPERLEEGAYTSCKYCGFLITQIELPELSCPRCRLDI